MKRPWSVLVVFDDARNRQRAMEVCDHLMQRFWAECEINVNWWSCAALETSAPTAAVEQAATADLIIFAIHPEKDFSTAVREWMESWLAYRGEREGALLDLASAEGEWTFGEGHTYLRHIAHRGGMDYFTHEPQAISLSLPDSLESVAARAQQVTAVLDQILHTLPPPQNPLLLQDR